MKSIFRFFLLFPLFLLTFQPALAQNKRQMLEQKRANLRKEIKHINKLLTTNKKKKHSVITKATSLNQKIKATEKLIRTNNQEANLLTKEIITNQKKISALRKELSKLKDDYAKMIRQSRRSHSKRSNIMFLFSSKNFLQAYKRLQYMKQYANYRKKQGQKIITKTEELQRLNTKLSKQRTAKKNLLAKNRATKKRLEADKKEQDALMATIRKKGSSYRKKIKQHQRRIKKIDAKIQKMIREAIAAENKKHGSSSKNRFSLTPEAKALAASFRANKGKLPWPLKAGKVVVHFGKTPSPLVPKITIESNGIRILTNKNEPVQAVFDGKVLRIQAVPGANKAILIQHGNYISVYNNLSKIYVHQGDIISTGETIGRVGIKVSTHRPVLMFSIYKNRKALNPLTWILRR